MGCGFVDRNDDGTGESAEQDPSRKKSWSRTE